MKVKKDPCAPPQPPAKKGHDAEHHDDGGIPFMECGGGSSSALDSFLQGVLMVEQTLPQRSRRNVVKRPGVSMDHEDLQELQGANTDIEDEAQVYTGLDEASILRELQEVSGSSNLSKRQSEDQIMNVAYKKAQLHAGTSKAARMNKGLRIMHSMHDKQMSAKGLKQLPIYQSHEDRSRYKIENKYGVKNNPPDKDYGEVTFVKLQFLPKHKNGEEQEKAAIKVDDMGHVKIITNRKENLAGNYEVNGGTSEIRRFNDAVPYKKMNYVISNSNQKENVGNNYEMNSGTGEIEKNLNDAVPYKEINDDISKSLQVSDASHEDSIASSGQKITETPGIENAIHKIQQVNNDGSSVEQSWETNEKKRPDDGEALQTNKDKDDPMWSGYLSYLNNFKNYEDYNSVPNNYVDAGQISQKIDISESQSTKPHAWNDAQFHEVDSESRASPYKEIIFQDPKLADNENLIDSIDSVTVPAKYSPSLVSRIDDSNGGRPKQVSNYLNNMPSTYRHSDTGRFVKKGDSRREFIRKYSYRDSLAKERVSNDENMHTHKKRLQKNNIAPVRDSSFSNDPEEKEQIHNKYLQDSRRRFIGKDPEILSIHEADLRYQGGYEHTLADLITGELATDIVRSIMNKVISDVNLRQHIASGFGTVTKAKSGRATKLGPSAEEMYCASRCAVERRLNRQTLEKGIPQSKCLALPNELKEFLKWMLQDSKEEIHSDSQNMLLPDQLLFYSAHNRKTLTTKPPEAENKEYDPSVKKKMQLVLQLLAEYEQLNDEEKDTVSKVHHYLQEELQRLQNESSEATSVSSSVEARVATTPLLPFESIKSVTNMAQQHLKYSLSDTEVDLIKKQLDLLGLGQNAKLGQRLSDRFEYSTVPDFQISPLPQQPIPLPPLLDNDDSVFK